MGRILQTLRVRYALDMIYTYSGNILIAVRPLSLISHQMSLLPIAISLATINPQAPVFPAPSCFVFHPVSAAHEFGSRTV